MKWNKAARTLAVASMTLASAAAWGQVNIGGAGGANNIGTVNTATVPTPVNNGAGVNPIGSTNGVLNALSNTGGPGGPSGVMPSGSPTGPMTPGSGLGGSPHDFVSNTDYGNTGAGLCTFCHTPHKAKSTLLLWNHTLSSNTFQWDVAATTSGTALPGFAGNAYNGPSAKCLSCHDGSVAIGDVGWFIENTRHNTTTTATDGVLSTFKIGANGDTTFQVGAGGNLSGTHPVAVPYPLNGAPNVYNGSTTGAQLATIDFDPDPTANNIRLYSDIGGGAIVGKVTAGKTGIECSSCHDPHNKASKDDYFLRAKLSGADKASGYICLQCHVK